MHTKHAKLVRWLEIRDRPKPQDVMWVSEQGIVVRILLHSYIIGLIGGPYDCARVINFGQIVRYQPAKRLSKLPGTSDTSIRFRPLFVPSRLVFCL